MATASVEIRSIARNDRASGAVYGPCIRQESLTVSSSTATLASSVTAAEVRAGAEIFRLVTDTACYFAKGTTPNPDATAPTSLTTARGLLAAGMDIPITLGEGDKLAVKALA